jgi:hypothetical protein
MRARFVFRRDDQAPDTPAVCAWIGSDRTAHNRNVPDANRWAAGVVMGAVTPAPAGTGTGVVVAVGGITVHATARN